MHILMNRVQFIGISLGTIILIVIASGIMNASLAHSATHVATLFTVWTVPEKADMDSGALLWIAVDYQKKKNDPLQRLAVVWKKIPESIWPVWHVALEGPAAALASIPGAIPLDNDMYTIELGKTSDPKPDRSYKAKVAYDGNQGSVSVRIVDETTQNSVLEKTVLFDTLEGRIRNPEAGLMYEREEQRFPIDMEPIYEPIGVTWYVRAHANDGQIVTLNRINNVVHAGYEMYFDLETPIQMNGRWRITLDDGELRRHVMDVRAYEGEQSVPFFTVPEEMAGRQYVNIEYVDDNRSFSFERLPLQIGEVNVHRTHYTVDESANTVTSSWRVNSTYSTEMEIIVKPTVWKIVWDEAQLIYKEQLISELPTHRRLISLKRGRTVSFEITDEIPKQHGPVVIHYDFNWNESRDVPFHVHDERITLSHADAPFMFRVVTYNLWATERWPQREPALRAIIEQMNPHVLAVQELRPETLRVLDEILPNHDRVAEPFEGWFYEGNIYWNTDMFRVEQYGAEDIGIIEPWRRMFWVRLRVKQTNDTVLIATAHYTWDGHEQVKHMKENPRIGMAEHTVRILKEIAHEEEPIIFMGDLNEAGDAIDTLRRGGFRDTVGSDGTPLPVTHPAHPSLGSHSLTLDWQLVHGPIQVIEAHAVDFDLDGIVASDHKPVMATYGLGSTADK